MAQRTSGPTRDPNTGAGPTRDPNTGAGPTRQVGGSGGNVKDGRALRHADNTEPPPENFGWLDGVKGVIGGPNRAANHAGVNIGPSGKLWRKPAGPYSTGDQSRGRKR